MLSTFESYVLYNLKLVNNFVGIIRLVSFHDLLLLMEVQIGSLEITHLFCMPDIQNIKKNSAEWKVVDAFLSIILHGIQKKLNKLLKSIVKNEFR